jgi:hypothetical protein
MLIWTWNVLAWPVCTALTIVAVTRSLRRRAQALGLGCAPADRWLIALCVLCELALAAVFAACFPAIAAQSHTDAWSYYTEVGAFRSFFELLRTTEHVPGQALWLGTASATSIAVAVVFATDGRRTGLPMPLLAFAHIVAAPLPTAFIYLLCRRYTPNALYLRRLTLSPSAAPWLGLGLYVVVVTAGWPAPIAALLLAQAAGMVIAAGSRQPEPDRSHALHALAELALHGGVVTQAEAEHAKAALARSTKYSSGLALTGAAICGVLYWVELARAATVLPTDSSFVPSLIMSAGSSLPVLVSVTDVVAAVVVISLSLAVDSFVRRSDLTWAALAALVISAPGGLLVLLALREWRLYHAASQWLASASQQPGRSTLPPLLARGNVVLMPVAPGIPGNDGGQRALDVA